MALGLVAFHYPRPDHREGLLRRMQASAEVMKTVDGCADAYVWETRDGGTLVSTGTFASEEAWTKAVQAVLKAGVDFDYDEREVRPRDVYLLVEPD